MATTARRTNLEIVEAAYEGFNNGDIEAVLATFDEEIEWIEPAGARYAGSYQGPESIAEGVFSNTAADYKGFQATPHRYVDGGDTVVVLGELSGTARATGEDISVPFAHVCEIEDGRMVRFTDYHDTEAIRRAFGN